MKRRNVAIIYLLILTIGTIFSLYIPKQEAVKADTATSVIPDEAIRLRILANSDREADQDVKRLIRDEVNQDITSWVAELTSLEDAREVIISHLDEIQATAESVMAKEGLNQSVKVDFGQAKFPTKLYGQFLYPAGDYEAVIITLGEGEGANWWCVLFPPLCFLDFSNGTAVSQSPFDEEEEGTALAANQTEVVANTVETEKQVEVVADQEEETASQTPVETEEATITNQQTEIEIEVEENQVEKPVENQTEEMPKEEATTVTVAEQSEQIYNGTEEPKIIEKSLFAEIFSKLF